MADFGRMRWRNVPQGRTTSSTSSTSATNAKRYSTNPLVTDIVKIIKPTRTLTTVSASVIKPASSWHKRFGR